MGNKYRDILCLAFTTYPDWHSCSVTVTSYRTKNIHSTQDTRKLHASTITGEYKNFYNVLNNSGSIARL